MCGCDGVTYTSACYATQVGVLSYTDGVCAQAEPDVCLNEFYVGLGAEGGSMCQASNDDVCGCDGETYTDGCTALFVHGVTTWTEGACP